MTDEELRPHLDHLIELMNDPKVGFKTFIGYGMMPICKPEYVEEMQETLSKCLEDDDFLEYVQGIVLGDDSP